MKTKADPKYGSNLAFLDMLFNLVMVFAFLFMIVFLMIRPKVDPVKPGVELKAEFVLTMTWPDNTLDDVDMWLKLPSGKVINWVNRDVEYAALERDDRGGYGDVHGTPPKLTKVNREMIMIRALVPGRYVVVGHLWQTFAEVEGLQTEKTLPYNVKIGMMKLNPRLAEVVDVELEFDTPRQSRAFFAFTIDEAGSVSNIEREPADVVVPDPSKGAP